MDCRFIALLGLVACARGTPEILLYAGAGTSRGDVAAIEDVLDAHHLRYTSARTLDGIELRRYRLLVIPGGNFIDMGEHLPTAAVHDAVQHGLNYLGICAGAFLAGDFKGSNFNLTGVRFGFYADEARGIRKEAVAIHAAAGPTLDQYWEDGPQLSGWGAVVARYPDGTPAVVQGTSGGGWVVLSGVHPEAPESWRRGLAFSTPASAAQAWAATLIESALRRAPLPVFP